MHPDQIGPYRIDQKIGSGGMGNVYYGVHTETDQIAAVKVLSASLAREEGFVQRFSREIQALRKLTSIHIVELFDDGSTDDGSWYYAMEFVDGETLTSLINRNKQLAWTKVSEITLQIAAALKAAHDAGVVHRDIKPSNLMITPDGGVKLTDFGVAHMFATTRLTRTGGVVGTAEYMSPEQARGQQATKRSDLYSLGAVMYAMLTGHPPFTGSNVNEILHKQQFAQVEKPRHYAPDMPQLFEQLVCQLLEKKPEQRIPDALVLSRKIEQIQSRIDFAARQKNREQKDLEAPLPSTVGVEYTEAAGSTIDDKVVQRPGPATLVRDVLSQEVASQLDRSPIVRFFDNTFVLVSMFVLVIGLGYSLWQNGTLTDAERFASAEATMSAEASAAWLSARDTILELLEADALPHHAKDMQLMIQQANQYEFCRSLERTTPIEGSRDEEIQRLISQAFDRFAHGNVVQARAELQSVAIMVANTDHDTYLGEFIETTLIQWAGDTSIRGRHQLLASVLKEAEGDRSDSRACIELLESALILYADDPMVAEEIGECRELLEAIRRPSVEESAGE